MVITQLICRHLFVVVGKARMGALKLGLEATLLQFMHNRLSLVHICSLPRELSLQNDGNYR